eukprot:2009755-Karenia_brevis.AAC.1
MVEEAHDPEMVRKINELSNTQAMTGKGMPFSDRMFQFKDQLVQKLDTTGANTNDKGKRKGIFRQSSKGSKIAKTSYVPRNKSTKGLGKARMTL